MTNTFHCRHCQSPLSLSFADLGTAPPSNSYVSKEKLNSPELYFPLKVQVCESCWLVQTVDFADRELYFSDDYAYLSSVSSSWLEHAKQYASKMIETFSLNGHSMVVEIASNDGYLLQYFQKKGVPNYGVEPTRSTAELAKKKGLRVIEDFFGESLASKLVESEGKADLIAANNVLAHVPDINDFVTGFSCLLQDEGVATFEFPHLLSLVGGCQFDTIYHEHYSYLSLLSVRKILEKNGLRIFNVEELATHGGSLRVFACLQNSKRHKENEAVARFVERELAAGLDRSAYYMNFQAEIHRVRNELLCYLVEAQEKGLKVAGYGAAAKGNTLLNFCGVKPDLIQFVSDGASSKQGRFLPGSRIPIYPPEKIIEEKPDRVLILPWNLKDEISTQLAVVRDWGGKFVTAIPEVREF